MKSLEQILESSGLTHPCDLDLLLFLARHADALISSERLAALVGYEPAQVLRSLDRLIARQLLLRLPLPQRHACWYRFRAEHGTPWAQEILEVTSTIEGRRHLRRLLMRHRSQPDRPPALFSDETSLNRFATQERTYA